MKVTYLHHSGFIVELPHSILVFDAITNIPPHFFSKGKHNYFFASHSHKDHFDQRIFSYGTDYTTNYILSDDIPEKGGAEITYLGPNKTIFLDDLKISTFRSTDRGVAFLVEAEDKVIYHAGDLNWWDWDTESHPNIDPAAEEADYKAYLEDLASVLGDKTIDIAFVPVDARLGRSATKAADYFIKKFHPRALVPMHFWDDYSVIPSLQQLERAEEVVIPSFDDRNQVLGI